MKISVIVTVLALVLSLGIAYANSTDISRSVPGSITINYLPIQATADINCDGTIDSQDLRAVAGLLNTHPAGVVREDVNDDGAIDVIDLAIVARHFGQEVEICLSG